MELVHGSSKASKLAQDDVISSMPDDVITNILIRLSLQDAARTGILSTNWKHKWTMLTQLVFDEEFYEHLKVKGKEKDFGRIITMFLDRLKGTMAKFYLYIEKGCNSILDVQDIDNWLLVLSKKEIMEFTLINMDETQIKLTTHLFSCLKLKHMELYNCHICPIDGFGGFPYLSSLDLSEVEFGSHGCGEFIAHSPLLEILELRDNSQSEIKQFEIEKRENLKLLTLPLRDLDNKEMITSSRIFELIGCFSKLQELNLDFWICKLSADAEVSVPAPAISSLQVDFSRIRGTQLRKVVFVLVRGLEYEVCLMKSLLDCSPLLEKMDISGKSLEVLGGTRGTLIFATKLLKLRRASRAEIEFDF